ncbi:MAG: FHA domain-containing protein [Myxococcales bacterium]|nr:FHA domain-containing protein [Myxococcales bacterium]
MAVLKSHDPARPPQSLAARSLVGRAPGCAVRLEDPSVSAEHASIFWTGARWELRDLASRNGTFVDAAKVGAGKRVPLRTGATIVFGSAAETWTLGDELPPVASARRARGKAVRVAEHGLLVLPSDKDPRVSVIETVPGHWLVEDHGASRPAVDQELLEADGAWVLSVPPPVPAGAVDTTRRVSKAAPALSNVTLDFAVSRDEEHVELAVVHARGVTALPARAHHYLLLTLARARQTAAASSDLPAAEHGWLHVEELGDMLHLDPEHLSVLIFRAREQLASSGVGNAGALIERRPSTRQLRLGTDRVVVRIA